MELTRNDVSGLILVAVTVGLLVVHGSERHDAPRSSGVPADTVPLQGIVRADAGAAGPVVFHGVSVVYAEGEEPRAHQTVVVVDGRVTAVGPVGSVETPAGAVVVRGAGSDVLVPATRLAAGNAAGIGPVGPLVRGAEMDLALLPGPPRPGTTELAGPEGLLLDGIWFPLPAVAASPAPAPTTAGGH